MLPFHHFHRVCLERAARTGMTRPGKRAHRVFAL